MKKADERQNFEVIQIVEYFFENFGLFRWL
jgi:hypothetical protein